MGASVAAMGVSTGLSGIGALMGAQGAQQSASASASNMMYQAMVSAYNAQLDQEKARMASQAGEIEAANKGMETRAAIGQQRATTAAAGVDTTTGSARDVQRGTQQIGMMDAETIRANAAARAWGYQVDATNEQNQAFAAMAGAEQAKKAGKIGVAQSLISGASTVANQWMRFSNPSMTFGM